MNPKNFFAELKRRNVYKVAINYAQTAPAFAQARFAFSIRPGISNAPLRSAKRIENCDAVIRVYDEAGSVIETHEHNGDFRER